MMLIIKKIVGDKIVWFVVKLNYDVYVGVIGVV